MDEKLYIRSGFSKQVPATTEVSLSGEQIELYKPRTYGRDKSGPDHRCTVNAAMENLKKPKSSVVRKTEAICLDTINSVDIF